MLILHSLRGVQSCVNIIILTNDEVNQMTQSDFKALITAERFQPFVVTLVDGFSIAIGEFQRNIATIARRSFWAPEIYKRSGAICLRAPFGVATGDAWHCVYHGRNRL
jgi:hypothetical protein